MITPTLIDNGPFRVSATYGMVCGIAPDQRGYCYGGNDRGQLGFSGTQGEATFTRPVGDLRLTIIAPASRFVCGLATDGAAWCWGDNTYGQLGSASAGEWSATPVRVDGGLRFTSVSVGIAHACGLATDGTAWCWGGGAQGQIGNGPLGVQSPIPVRVTAPVRFASVDAGGYFACGRGVDGFTYCWGNNTNGELADGTTTSRSVAVRVVPP